MDGPQAIILVVLVGMCVVGVGIATSYASVTTADDRVVNETNATGAGMNETVTFNSSNLDGAYYSENATVLDENGTELDDPNDYVWHPENGTLTVQSSEAANESLTANYTVWERSNEQQTVTATIAGLQQAGAWLPFVLFVGLLLVAMTTLGGLS